jgi:penicillin-binding protein 1A
LAAPSSSTCRISALAAVRSAPRRSPSRWRRTSFCPRTRRYERKIKEAILSFRIEQAYPKDRILELYLNEIFFGLGAYGIAGAALTYFDKSVNELTVAEAAYLAALPKGPANYHPFKHADRRDRAPQLGHRPMVENGYVTREDGDKAKAEPLGVTPRRTGTYLFAGEYFTEEVRRQIIARYGENALYEGGLSVRTTLDPKVQVIARRAMQNGLISYDERRGYRGPVKSIDIVRRLGRAARQVKGWRMFPNGRWQSCSTVRCTGLPIGLQPEKRHASGKVVGSRRRHISASQDMGGPCRVLDRRPSRQSRRRKC